MLQKLGVESQFVGGLRVTDAETAKIAEMVLAGSINKEIVGWIILLVYVLEDSKPGANEYGEPVK